AGLFLHRLGDVGRGHRAEKAALASGSRLDGDRASLELRGKGLRALALASLACLAIAPHRVGLLLTYSRCLQRATARTEIVARVAVGDVDEIALLAQVFDIVAQYDSHAAATSDRFRPVIPRCPRHLPRR